MNTKEHLIAAKALIDTPEKWAHENKDRIAKGGQCRCAVDALWAVDLDERALDSFLPGGQIAWDGEMVETANFNDHPDTTHADVMALFDRAIAAQDVTA